MTTGPAGVRTSAMMRVRPVVAGRAFPRISRWVWTAVAALVVAAIAGSAGARVAPSSLFPAAAFVALVAITFADLRVGLGVLAFAMVFSPELGGVVYVRADDVILVAVMLGWIGRQAALREPISENPLSSAMLLLAAGGLAAFALSIGGGNVDPFTGERVPMLVAGLHWVKRVEYLLIIFLVSQALKTRREVQFFAALLILGGVLAAARTLPLIVANAGEAGFRVAAPFDTGEANTFGEYLMFVIALALGLLLIARSLHVKLALVSAIAVSGFVFLHTFSRGSYIGLVVAVLVVAVLKDPRLLIPVALLAILLPGKLPADVSARVQTIPEEARTLETSDGGGNALLARIDSYRVATRRLSERPVLGYGPGVVSLARIESQYAREAIDGGLVGLAVFLLFLRRAWRTGREVVKRAVDPLDFGIGLGYLAGLAGMAVAGLGAISFTTIRTMEAFCFVTGLVVVLWRLQQPEPALPEELPAPERVLAAPALPSTPDEPTLVHRLDEIIDLRDLDARPRPKDEPEEDRD